MASQRFLKNGLHSILPFPGQRPDANSEHTLAQFILWVQSLNVLLNHWYAPNSPVADTHYATYRLTQPNYTPLLQTQAVNYNLLVSLSDSRRTHLITPSLVPLLQTHTVRTQLHLGGGGNGAGVPGGWEGMGTGWMGVEGMGQGAGWVGRARTQFHPP
jgi:hypothetical protein